MRDKTKVIIAILTALLVLILALFMITGFFTRVFSSGAKYSISPINFEATGANIVNTYCVTEQKVECTAKALPKKPK